MSTRLLALALALVCLAGMGAAWAVWALLG